MTILLSTVLTSSLFAVPAPIGRASPQCAGPDHPFGAQVYALGTFDEVHRNLEKSVEDLQRSLERDQGQAELRDRVRREIERIRFFPERVALDADVDALITRAMLVVAASVQTCDPQFAQAWVDRALARQGPEPNPTDIPTTVVALYDQQKSAASKTALATIRIDCEIACAAFVDGHSVLVAPGKVTAYPVIPGIHDVWIFHAPLGDDPTRASFLEIELGSGQQNRLDFPDPSNVDLPPSREEWWSAWSFAQRIEWAFECKKALHGIPPDVFEALIAESPEHTRVLAQDPVLRELRFRVALHLADLLQQSGRHDEVEEILDRTLLWTELLGSPSTLVDAVGKFPHLIDPFVQRAAAMTNTPRGALEIDCERCFPAIDGVVVDADMIVLPAGEYRVDIYPSSPKGKIETVDDVIVQANKTTLVWIDPPSKLNVLPHPKRKGIVLPADVTPHQKSGAVSLALGSTLLFAALPFVGLAVVGLVPDQSPNALNPVTSVSIVVSGALLISGVTLVAVGAKRKRVSKTRASIAPSITQNSFGLGMVGQF